MASGVATDEEADDQAAQVEEASTGLLETLLTTEAEEEEDHAPHVPEATLVVVFLEAEAELVVVDQAPHDSEAALVVVFLAEVLVVVVVQAPHVPEVVVAAGLVVVVVVVVLLEVVEEVVHRTHVLSASTEVAGIAAAMPAMAVRATIEAFILIVD